MLGRKISDPEGAEMQGEIRGLGYLEMDTVFSSEKILRRTETVSSFGIPAIDGKKISGYEVHMGRPADGESRTFPGKAGAAASGREFPPCGGEAAGTYIHGIFDGEEFREAFLSYLCERKGRKRGKQERGMSYPEYKEEQLSRLSAMMRKHLDIPAIYKMMGL